MPTRVRWPSKMSQFLPDTLTSILLGPDVTRTGLFCAATTQFLPDTLTSILLGPDVTRTRMFCAATTQFSLQCPLIRSLCNHSIVGFPS